MITVLESVVDSIKQSHLRNISQDSSEGCIKVKIECPDCHGHGNHSAFATLPENIKMVCRKCGGKGYTIAKLKLFEGKKRRSRLVRVIPAGEIAYSTLQQDYQREYLREKIQVH